MAFLLPRNPVFDDQEWKALYIVSKKQPPPDTPPTLNVIIRTIAGFGGFLYRAADGLPGPETIPIGLQQTKDFTLAIEPHRRALDPGCA
ncbi:MAG: IS4 family transposase [Gammaproteobacteria bacterium]